MSDEAERAVDIANLISEVCAGEPTAAVYMALSMMIGGMAALAEKPDLDGCLKLIEEGARWQFELARAQAA